MSTIDLRKKGQLDDQLKLKFDEVLEECVVPFHEYIENIWVYNAKCVKRKRSEGGKLFTIPDRNTYTCGDFVKGGKL